MLSFLVPMWNRFMENKTRKNRKCFFRLMRDFKVMQERSGGFLWYSSLWVISAPVKSKPTTLLEITPMKFSGSPSCIFMISLLWSVLGSLSGVIWSLFTIPRSSVSQHKHSHIREYIHIHTYGKTYMGNISRRPPKESWIRSLI